MNEPDLIFLDVDAALFYAVCVGAFLLGVYLVAVYFPSGPLIDKRLLPRISPTAFILSPVLLGLSLHILGIISVLKNGVLLQLLLSGERAATASGTWDAEGTIGLSGTLLTGVIWWALWRYQQLRLSRTSSLVTRFFLFLAIISVLASASLMQDRVGFIPLIVGTAIIVLLRKRLDGELNARVAFTYGGLFFGVIMICFVLIGVIRGINGFQEIVSSIIGYTIASYNRLSALLSGRLQYPYGGRGLYLSGFLAFNNSFNSILPVREILRWPDFYDVWDSEFGAVWRANLDGRFIWSGTFGYIYSDLGWLSPGFVFLYGLLYGWVWRAVCCGRAFGIVLYPWCAFCILLWFGSNLLLDTPSAMLVIVALVLSGYDYVLAGEGNIAAQGRASGTHQMPMARDRRHV